MTMELRDLPPKQDPKGGAPKTPYPGMSRKQLEDELANHRDELRDNRQHSEFERATKSNSAVFWRMIAFTVLAANIAGFSTWLLWGMDSVKHSEIDQIMATRAPYLHDKQRIDDSFAELKRRDGDIENRLHQLEILYYRDHPEQQK